MYNVKIEVQHLKCPICLFLTFGSSNVCQDPIVRFQGETFANEKVFEFGEIVQDGIGFLLNDVPPKLLVLEFPTVETNNGFLTCGGR